MFSGEIALKNNHYYWILYCSYNLYYSKTWDNNNNVGFGCNFFRKQISFIHAKN